MPGPNDPSEIPQHTEIEDTVNNHFTHPLTALFVASMLASGAAAVERERAAVAVRTAVSVGRLHEDALYVDVSLPGTLAEAKAALVNELATAEALAACLYSGAGPDVYSQWAGLSRLARAELLAARAEVIVAALSDREFLAVAA